MINKYNLYYLFDHKQPTYDNIYKIEGQKHQSLRIT